LRPRIRLFCPGLIFALRASLVLQAHAICKPIMIAERA
jgi:hypothetical protein